MMHRIRRAPALLLFVLTCVWLLGSGGEAPRVAELSGSWTGTTEQGKTISFEIASGALTRISIDYEVHGEGCSVARSTAATFPEPLALQGPRFGFSTTSGSLRIALVGSFPSAREASGRAEFTLAPAEGAPCAGTTATTWTATRQ